jgi:hypothetical protein
MWASHRCPHVFLAYPWVSHLAFYVGLGSGLCGQVRGLGYKTSFLKTYSDRQVRDSLPQPALPWRRLYSGRHWLSGTAASASASPLLQRAPPPPPLYAINIRVGCWHVDKWRPCPLDAIVTVSGSSSLPMPSIFVSIPKLIGYLLSIF